MFELHREIVVLHPLPEVFAFFADAGNLQQLTPGWLSFEMLTERPVAMAPGTLIDYRLRIRGIPIRWRSEITAWEPPYRFVDEQRRGPYRAWIHEHRFRETAAGTAVRDHLRYDVLGGIVVERLLVRPDLRRIFDYRHRRLAERFGVAAA